MVTIRVKLVLFLLLSLLGLSLLTVNGCRFVQSSKETVEFQNRQDSDPSLTGKLQTTFRPDGGFKPEPRPPEEFRELIWISLITGTSRGYGASCAPKPCSPPAGEERNEWLPYPPKGILVTKNHLFEWSANEISKESFAFTTEAHEGTSYRFVGQFSVDGEYERIKPAGVVLTGKLERLMHGRPVADNEISLSWFSWDE